MTNGARPSSWEYEKLRPKKLITVIKCLENFSLTLLHLVMCHEHIQKAQSSKLARSLDFQILSMLELAWCLSRTLSIIFEHVRARSKKLARSITTTIVCLLAYGNWNMCTRVGLFLQIRPCFFSGILLQILNVFF